MVIYAKGRSFFAYEEQAMKKLVVAADKGGYPLKETVKAYLLGKGYEVEDVGTLDPEKPVFFFEGAPNAAKAIQEGRAEMGLLFCGTGRGRSQGANKFHGIRAAVCESVYAAVKCREINDSNVLTMGTWIVGGEMGIAMAEAFLNTDFTQGLPKERQEYLKGARDQVIAVDTATRK
jgi:ribose 5-phosphate isomerase B